MTRPSLRMVLLVALACATPALAQDPAPAQPTAGPPVLPTPVPPPGATTGTPPTAAPPTTGTPPSGPPTSGATPPVSGAPPVSGTPPVSGPPPAGAPGEGDLIIGDPNPQLPPQVGEADEVTLNFVEQDLYTLLDFFARTTRRNFVLADKKDLEGKKVTIISHHPIPADLAWQAFLSALEASGYTTYDSGGNWFRIVKLSDAGSRPIQVGIGRGVPMTENYVTQLITLENVSASEVSKVIEGMKSAEGKIVAYQPSNTLIITDTGSNIRKMIRIMDQLDVEAPQAKLEIIPLRYATASDVKAIIEALYGTAETSAPTTTAPTRPTRSSRRTPTPAPVADEGSVTAGDESKFIAKVIDDERTNSLIVLANPEGLEAVRNLVAQLDQDVDPLNRAQIHVVRLEHAKAADVATVLQELSQGSGGSRSGSGSSTTGNRRSTTGGSTGRTTTSRPAPPAGGAADDGGGESGAIAAFDSGMRIAPDENTNSLVIIANQEDFAVVEDVIRSLDIERKQVYVDVVILELSSEDALDLGIAGHVPVGTGENSFGVMGAGLNASSLGFTQDFLTGLALGVFGQSIPVTLADGTTTVNVPAFGIVLNALKTNAGTSIISNPSVKALDNEEAHVSVGRKVPFPTTSGLNNLGQPVVSFQREDVAISLDVTPRVNSADAVTLEIHLEAEEIEADKNNLTSAQSGPITSNREVETVALVRDNQTVVLGGLIGATDTEVETKIPVLGDLPVLGALFRGSSTTSRKTNLMVFLTPHIVDDPEDEIEIMRVKEAQRQEFLRRFYGKSRDQQMEEMNALLRYSMNFVDEPSVFRGPDSVSEDFTLDGVPVSDQPRPSTGSQPADAGTPENGTQGGQ